MTSISALSATGLSSTRQTNASQLDQSAFLRLMTAQLQQQDPFNPTDNTQMVAQMAQFSTVSGVAEMNATLRTISDQLSAQNAILVEIRAARPAATGE